MPDSIAKDDTRIDRDAQNQRREGFRKIKEGLEQVIANSECGAEYPFWIDSKEVLGPGIANTEGVYVTARAILKDMEHLLKG